MGKMVLLIDDDPQLGKLVDAILRPIEVTVCQAFSGMEGLEKAYETHPDLVILDIMMPGMDGFDVCARLRELSKVPVLMLTARTNETDMLHGFNVGVDDFVRKPFNKNELEARVRALLRRKEMSGGNRSGTSFVTAYQDCVLEIDLANHVIKLLDKIVELTPREYGLLECLVREQGRIISHRDLMQQVWGDTYLNNPAQTSLYVYYVRKKIQDGRHGHQYIHTMWGRGYWFEPRKED